MFDITTCPACGGLAHVQWRDVFESTDGPIEHAKVLCVERAPRRYPSARGDRSGARAQQDGDRRRAERAT